MITDRFIKQGSTHALCEDYAFCFSDRVVVCDGCSSSENTDVGARLLALTPEDRLESVYHQYRGILGDTFMDATRLEARKVVTEDNPDSYGIFVEIIGDGYFIHFSASGNTTTEIQFSSGAPLYLSYNFSEQRKLGYFETFKDSEVIETSWASLEHKKFDACIERKNITKYSGNKYVVLGGSVLLASDGLASFANKQGGILPVKKVIEDMLKFKNYTPRFIQRRMNALCKEYAKEGYVNTDDVSVVVMSFMDEV